MKFGSRNSIFLAWHMGLGDAIAFSNLAIELANRFDRIILPVWEHNYFPVREIFDDRLDVLLLPFATHEDYSHHIQVMTERKQAILLGNYAHGDTPKLMLTPGLQRNMDAIHWIYKTLPQSFDISIAGRWSIHQIQERVDAAVDSGEIDFVDIPNVPYIFIHDDPERGFVIDENRLSEGAVKIRLENPFQVRPENNGLSILKWAQLLVHADEVHVIDSSFFHLAESLALKTDRPVLHRYARPIPDDFGEYHNTRHPWKILT